MVAKAESGGSGDRVIRQIKQQASEVSDRLRMGARSIKDQLAEKTSEVTQAVKDEANRLVEEQKAQAAKKVEKVGSMIRRTGNILHAGKIDAAARYVDMAAEAVEQAAEYLEEKDPGEIADDAAEVVRRHPVAVFGGIFVAGILAGRFIAAGVQSDGEGD